MFPRTLSFPISEARPSGEALAEEAKTDYDEEIAFA